MKIDYKVAIYDTAEDGWNNVLKTKFYCNTSDKAIKGWAAHTMKVDPRLITVEVREMELEDPNEKVWEKNYDTLVNIELMKENLI